uniref:PPM-type phosphatase domain-containing protein n=1 Tax=Globisporangium ultimum (strain ATCC 200006 / CBS 805.95 / DAOM BR144) TaxID=431595 RepID=K3X5B4_GLOUD
MSENPGEQVQTLKMNDGAQYGGVLRKYENEIEHHRRRSTTVLLDPPSSSESGKVLSFGRARNSGVNRLLRSSTSSTSSYHSCADTSRSNSSVLENSSDDAGFTTAAAISSQNGDSNKPQHTLNSAPASPHHKQQGNGYSHDLDKHDDTKQKPSAAAHDNTKSQQPPDFDNLLIPSSVEPYIVSEYQGHTFPEHVWTHVVLKMTAFSDDDVVTSFRFGVEGGSIGRDAGVNTASIPADKLLKHEAHARILYAHGGFYLQNCDESSSGTFVRLGPCSDLDEDDDGRMQWPLDPNVVFRVGKSDFLVTKYNEGEQTMELTVLSGKLQGTVFTIGTSGAGIGRSADNEIHASDGELSRKHAAIWFDELTHKFYLIDLNSTNGTFMKLVGPYHEPYRLEIGDDLLISQTCLTVNRFDFGVHASMGQRKTMEDAHTIIQDLNIESLSCLGLHPQSYFAVYDGHGGAEASSFLGDTLHHNIIDEFRFKKKQFDPLLKLPQDEIHAMVRQRLISAFEKTDDEFMHESERPQAGSTATTVLIAGKYLFVANTGDSRTVLSRKRVAVRLSNDHKPSRADEAQRIRDTGGFVIHGRIMGELAVSRAFGDSPFKTFELPEPPKEEANEASGNSGNGSGSKKPHSSEYDSQELPVNPNEILKGPLVIATPEVTTTEITDDDEFLLLASDGLFDVLKDQDAVNYLRQKLVELNDVQRAVEALVEYAIFQQRSTDNVTAVVILFKEPRELSK